LDSFWSLAWVLHASPISYSLILSPLIFTRSVWKFRGLVADRRCYAEGGITAAHCRQSTNFSDCPPRSCSAILKWVLLNDRKSNSDDG
jgi:hypothetical protein